MQVQGSPRPEALKFQAAQPPAVTQGPGNHRLEHGRWTRVGGRGLGNRRSCPVRCAPWGRDVCHLYVCSCAPSTPHVGGWFWLSSRVPRRDDQAAGEVSLTLAQQIHGMPLWRARGAGLGRVLRDVRPPGEDQWGWTRTADARAFKMADACCGDLRQWGDNVGWVGM